MSTRKIFLGIVPPQVSLYGQKARPQPPMGLAYAMNAVKKAGWGPVLFDTCAEAYKQYREDKKTGVRITGHSISNILTRIGSIKPEFIGISLGLSTDHDYVKQLVGEIKQAYDIPIVLGGSHASLMHREIIAGLPIERIPADFVVAGRDIGSGELSIYHLLKEWKGNKDFKAVPGIAFAQNGKLIVTPSVSVSKTSLDSLEMPKRDLFSVVDGMDIYSKINLSHTGPVDYPPYAVVHTSRGCGGSCTFCHISYGDFNPALIGRSFENINMELRQLKSKGVRTISIEDDNFGGFNNERTSIAVKILQEIQRLGFKAVYFPNGLTIRSMINKGHSILRQLLHMADRGMKIRSSLPIECSNGDTLRKIIRKPHTPDDVVNVLEELKKRYLHHPNIELDAFFMVGIVGYQNGKFISEPMDSIHQTLEMTERIASLGIRVNVWWSKPNPNGPQYKLWRSRFPEEPFYHLQFLFPAGIWGTSEQEAYVDELIRNINQKMNESGTGSMRPIYPIIERQILD